MKKSDKLASPLILVGRIPKMPWKVMVLREIVDS